jgi:caspase domain-containing protein
MVARDVGAEDAPQQPPVESLGPDNDYALVIGIDDYPEFRSLRGASADAQAFSDWLKSESGGRVPEANIKRLLSKSMPVEPLQHDVDNVLSALLEAVRRAGRGRRIYLFFSGHGAAMGGAHNLALCLAMWSKKLIGLAMSSRSYLDLLVDSGHFDEIVAFFDCCRLCDRAIGVSPYIVLDPSERGRRNARTFFAYATESRSPAFEVQVDDAVHGVFTSCLLEGLKYAQDAKDPQRRVTSTSLGGYLDVWVQREAQNRGLHQRAEVVDGMARGAPAIFTGHCDSPLLRVEFVEAKGEVELSDGTGQLVHQGDAADGTWELGLSNGIYKLVETATGRCLLFDHKGEKVGIHVKF